MLSWPKGNYFPVTDMATDKKQQRAVFLDWESSSAEESELVSAVVKALIALGQTVC